MKLVFIVSTFILMEYVYCQDGYVGDDCTVQSTGAVGQCQLLENCPTALHGLHNQGITPQRCGFQGIHPIVCCVGNVQQPPVTTNTTIKPTTTVPAVTRVDQESEQEPCTPGGEQGECVYIGDCPALANAFANPINGTEESLKKFKCRGFPFQVCCTSAWNSTTSTTTTTTTTGNELLAARSYCGLQHRDDYFSVNDTISIDEFPWLAALVGTDPNTGKDEVACHGSLINSRYILSTAQCVDPREGFIYPSKVLLGQYYTRNTTSCEGDDQYGLQCTEAEVFGIEERIVHPFSDRLYGLLFDIALVRLNKRVMYSDYIRPICLPMQGAKFAEAGDILYTTGFGNIYYGEPAPVKNKVKNDLLTPKECQELYKQAIPTYHMCTRDLENNTEFLCEFNIGAPVMFSYRGQWQLEGIVSQGFACSKKYPVTLHTRVTHYLEWIKQNVRT